MYYLVCLLLKFQKKNKQQTWRFAWDILFPGVLCFVPPYLLFFSSFLVVRGHGSGGDVERGGMGGRMLHLAGLLGDGSQSDLIEGRKSRDRRGAESWREAGWHLGPDGLC